MTALVSPLRNRPSFLCNEAAEEIGRLRGLLREALPHIYIPDDCDRTDEIRDKIDAAQAGAPEAK